MAVMDRVMDETLNAGGGCLSNYTPLQPIWHAEEIFLTWKTCYYNSYFEKEQQLLRHKSTTRVIVSVFMRIICFQK